MSCVPAFVRISELVFSLYMVCAAYQDQKEKAVLRATHLMGLASAGLYGLSAVISPIVSQQGGADCREDAWAVRSVAFLAVLLCEGICRCFSFYGLADSLVFLNCSLYYWVRIDAWLSFVLFWWLKAFSGLLLVAVQFARRRRLKWKLDEPAAYIPYILCAFALTNTVLKGYNNWY